MWISCFDDESFDSNYKLFKNQNGELFARYVGTNCRNGSPMKKIWVPKSYVESLQVNVLVTPPMKNRNPRSTSSYGPNSSYGSNSSKGSKSSYDYHRANNSVSQGRAKGYEYSIILLIIMFISPRRISLLIHMLTLTPLMWNEMDWLLCHLSRMELAEWWTLCHPFRCGWWRKRTNLFCRVRSPNVP